ncbi:unnamed protein product [Protopolystoma xenopodis]|uniref:Uncharacterized protein n=1 Tax=Protopolystoma xenopodis TaxID=117903 RepID=A0A3S5CD68_9PLAT|nr:unnamed protein product [Protopolystoma xenopodis]
MPRGPRRPEYYRNASSPSGRSDLLSSLFVADTFGLPLPQCSSVCSSVGVCGQSSLNFDGSTGSSYKPDRHTSTLHTLLTLRFSQIYLFSHNPLLSPRLLSSHSCLHHLFISPRDYSSLSIRFFGVWPSKRHMFIHASAPTPVRCLNCKDRMGMDNQKCFD